MEVKIVKSEDRSVYWFVNTAGRKIYPYFCVFKSLEQAKKYAGKHDLVIVD